MVRARDATGRLACVFLGICAAGTLQAAGSVDEVLSYRKGHSVLTELRVRDLLDERTSSTIDSGLSGTCVYHIHLEDDSKRVVGERLLELSLRLDLWENRYLVEGPAGRSTFPSLAEADSAWSHLRDIVVCATERLEPGKRYRIRVEIAVQPLGPTDRARLSRYISGTSGQNNEEVALDVGAFLGRLLAGSSAGEDLVSFTGPFFQLGDLETRE